MDRWEGRLGNERVIDLYHAIHFPLGDSMVILRGVCVRYTDAVGVFSC